MTINVTQEDINTNEHSCQNCPVFTALSRIFPGKIRGVGGHTMWYVDKNGREQTKQLPEKVWIWIRNYDCGIRPMVPFSFEFNLEL